MKSFIKKISVGVLGALLLSPVLAPAQISEPDTIFYGQVINRTALLKSLVELHYKRNDAAFSRGAFRVRGDSVEVFPAWKLSFIAFGPSRP